MSELDLSPRPREDVPVRRRRHWAPLAVLVLVVLAGGLIVTQFLRSAVDYYCNVDEIGERGGCEEGRRVRIQGTVDEGSVAANGAVTTFTMSFNGASVPVRYDGQPGGIFQECVAVVVHGELDRGTLRGDRLEVKHSNEYRAENADRLDGAAAAEQSSPCAAA
jgi:cytochrome c-type biogenesis protein CcmE